MAKDRVDHSGEVHGRLTLLKKNNDKQEYYCSCDCGKFTKDNPKLIPYKRIRSGNTKSCGCLHKEKVSHMMQQMRAKHNHYDLSGEYGVCYDEDKQHCWLFDLEDFDLIKDYYWTCLNETGYACAKDKERCTTVLMSRIVMGLDINDKRYVDHIYHNVFDNRKAHLRICSNSQNNMNRGTPCNNTSGVTGVGWDNQHKKWVAQIMINKKHIHLGLFSKMNDAIKARKEAEEKYFGQYSYDNSIKGDVSRVDLS